MASIFKISSRLSELINRMHYSEDGIDESEIQEIEDLEISLSEKFDGIAGYIRTNEGQTRLIDEEIDRLRGIKESVKNERERFEKILHIFTQKYGTENNGKKEFSTDLNRFTYSRSSSVIEDNIEEIPGEFVIIERRIDKQAIKSAIKEGREVPGVHIEEKLNFQIK